MADTHIRIVNGYAINLIIMTMFVIVFFLRKCLIIELNSKAYFWLTKLVA